MKKNTEKREKNLALYDRMMSGDKSAINEMIELNMPYTTNVVTKIIKQSPGLEYIRDDLLSQAGLGLTYAVNKMATGKRHPNPNPGFFIWQRMLEYLDNMIKNEIKHQHEPLPQE